MNRLLAAGLVLTATGLVGYGVGVFVAYEGRAFSVTVVMIGVSLVAVGGTVDEAGGVPAE